MSKLFVPIYIFFSSLSLHSFGQQLDFKLFKGDGFEFSYPEKWTAAKDGKVYNFYLDENLGDISISVYKNLNLSSEAIKKMILELNEKRAKSDVVKVGIRKNQKEYNYEYVENGVKWFIKGILNKKDFFLITLNWTIKDWAVYEKTFFNALNSFKIL